MFVRLKGSLDSSSLYKQEKQQTFCCCVVHYCTHLFAWSFPDLFAVRENKFRTTNEGTFIEFCRRMPAVAPLTNTPTHVTDCTTYTQTVTTAITALMYSCTSLLCAFECVCWGAEGSWQRLCVGVRGGSVWVCVCAPMYAWRDRECPQAPTLG